MNRDEFENGYAARSGVTVEWLHRHGRRAEACDCGDTMCEGWAMGYGPDDRAATRQEVLRLARRLAEEEVLRLRGALERIEKDVWVSAEGPEEPSRCAEIAHEALVDHREAGGYEAWGDG